MSLLALHGIVPPLPTPLRADGTFDREAMWRIVDFQVSGGVHGLWVLGTTARFDLIPDSVRRAAAEVVVEANAGRLPLVLNVSDLGTERTLELAARFDDLPYDYYAALPPWYQPMAVEEVVDYFQAVADAVSRPLVIYNAPWVCNQLPLEALRRLSRHPRIVGTKDVGPSLNATLSWTVEERRAADFSYLAGNDNLHQATALGADGFVTSLSVPFPELAVAIWDATRRGDAASAGRLQEQWLRLAHTTAMGPFLASLEVACEYRGLVERMLPHPLRRVDEATARRIVAVFDEVGYLPEGMTARASRKQPVR